MTLLVSPNLGAGFRRWWSVWAGEAAAIWSDTCLGERFPCQGALWEGTGETSMIPCPMLLAKLYTSLSFRWTNVKEFW